MQRRFKQHGCRNTSPAGHELPGSALDRLSQVTQYACIRMSAGASRWACPGVVKHTQEAATHCSRSSTCTECLRGPCEAGGLTAVTACGQADSPLSSSLWPTCLAEAPLAGPWQ